MNKIPLNKQPPKAPDKKSVVYIDVDDDITTIIDKVLESKSKIVAIVLPKRAVSLQSSVNMRLLKKAADSDNKHIVLITTETPLLPLAGAAGIHVASTANSKPLVPAVPKPVNETIDVGEIEEAGDVPLDKAKSIGSLAGLPETETIELDNTDSEEAVVAKSDKPNKKLKIPNFNSFRTRLFIGLGLLTLLILLWALTTFVLPKAEIIVRTDTSSEPAGITFTTSTTATELNQETSVVPAKRHEVKKTASEKAPATGEKDLGTKANGTVSLKNCSSSVAAPTIPSGTGVSSGSFTFITQEPITLPASSFNGLSQCTTPTKDVNVVASEVGDKYNLSARSYTVSGFAGVQGTGSAMTGGTSKIVKVVSDKDVETAKLKIAAQNEDALKEVTAKLQSEGLIGIADTFTTAEPTFTATPKVGDEAGEVTVTQTITYSMIGVKQADLETLLRTAVSKTIDQSKKNIKGFGFDKAVYRITERKKNGDIVLTLDTSVVIGPEIKEEDIKSLVAGKKRANATKDIEGIEGVTFVQVNLKPFYVGSVPKKQSKILIKLEQNDTGSRSDNP